MLPRPPALAMGLLCLVACGRDPGASDQTAPTCPPSETVRLADLPTDLGPTELYNVDFNVHGDKLLYALDYDGSESDVYWLIDLCTGDREQIETLDADMRPDIVLDTPAGKHLLGFDLPSQDEYIIDRLDVPGTDEPRRVPGLPAGLRGGQAVAGGAVFGDWNSSSFHTNRLSAAGIGTEHRTTWFFGGDPDVPAISLGDAIVDGWSGDGELLLLDDDGVLRRFDPATGTAATELTGVRGAFISDDGRWLIWQELGDDLTEAVHLRDRQTGHDTFLITNPWAAGSWGRLSDGGGGASWVFNGEHPVAAFMDPAGIYAAVFRLDTGESIPVPPHAGTGLDFGPYFRLFIADPGAIGDALWDPLSGDPPRVWRPKPIFFVFDYRAEENAFTYLVDVPDDDNVGAMRRFDLTLWDDREIAPRLYGPIEVLADGRYLSHFRVFDLKTAREYGDLRIFDPTSQLFIVVAESVHLYKTIPGGIVYIDTHVPHPAIYLTPLSAP